MELFIMYTTVLSMLLGLFNTLLLLIIIGSNMDDNAQDRL